MVSLQRLQLSRESPGGYMSEWALGKLGLSLLRTGHPGGLSYLLQTSPPVYGSRNFSCMSKTFWYTLPASVREKTVARSAWAKATILVRVRTPLGPSNRSNALSSP